MKLIREIKKYFTFHNEVLTLQEEEIYLGRLYAFLGVLFTPFVFISTLKFQNDYNLLANVLIDLLFGFILFGSYKIKSISKNIHLYLYIHYIFISIYTILNAYLKGFPYNEVFSILVLLFVFGTVITDLKKLIIFYGITMLSLIITLNFTNSLLIDASYLISFLFLFFCINYFINRSKSNTQNKLENREKFLKTLFNETVDGFLLINVQTKEIVDCNKQLLHLFGLKNKSEIVGYKQDKFKKFKDTDQDYLELEREIAERKIFYKNIVFINSKGREFIADTVYNEVNVENNRFYFVRVTDISQKLEIEKKIIKSEKKYRSLVENNVAGVFRTTMTGKLLEINHAFAEVFGYTKSELMQLNVVSLYHSNQDRINYLEEIIKYKKLYNKQLYLKTKNNNDVWTLVNVAIRKDGEEEFIEGTLLDITTIKKANESLLESKRLLSEAQRIAKIGNWVFDLHSGIIEWSDEVSEIYNLDPNLKSGFLTMKDLEGVIHREDRKCFIEEISSKKTINEFYDITHRIYLKDGIIKYVHQRGIPVFDKDNNQVKIMGTVQDITDQVLINNQLKESEERFKILSNVAIEGVVLSKNEIILDANHQFVTMHGYDSVAEIIGKKFVDFIHKDNYDEVKKHLNSTDKNFYTVRSVKKDGSLIYVETRGENIPYGDGTIRASVVLNVTDRTLKDQQVKDSEERFKRLSEAAYEGIIIHHNGIILDSNDKFCKLVGYSSEELHNFNSLQLATRETLDQVIYKMETNNTDPFEGTIINKNGKEISVSIRGRKIPYKGLTAIVSSIRDISFEKEAARKLQEEQLRVRVAQESNKILNTEIAEREKIQQELQKTQRFLTNIINSSLDVIISTDKEGKITNFNKAAEKTFGYKATEMIGKTSELLYADSKEKDQITEALNSKQGKFFGEIVNKKKSGETFISFISASRLVEKNGISIGSMGVSRDITNIKAAEEELKKSEEKYRDLFENASDLIQSIDHVGNIIFVNSAWKTTLEYSEKEIIGKSIFNFIHPDVLEHCKLVFSKILKGEKPDRVEIEFLTKSGKKVIVEGNTSSKIENGKAVSTRGIFRNITLNKEIQKSLIDKQSQLSGIINNTSDLMLSIDRNYRIIESNSAFNKIALEHFGVEIKSGTPIFEVTDSVRQQRFVEIYEKVLTGKFYSEIFDYGTNNEKSYYESSYNPIFDSEGVEVIAIAIFSKDITERILNEQEISNGLKEKEILLAEIHHRVKNNLQVISSILNLQSSYVTDKGTLDILKESQNRVKSMAFIHECLYRTNDFSSINFSDYIKNLASNLMYSYQVYDNFVELKLDLDEIQVDLDQSIPAGLIINELVTNSLKYGFPNEREGFIEIKLKQQNGYIIIIVQDNGVGMTKDINFEQTDSLGLQLVYSLTEQLDGKLSNETNQNKGTKFELKFKKI